MTSRSRQTNESGPLIFDHPAVVRRVECDEHGRASVHVLAAILQDAATRHADALGVGVEDLGHRELTWILGRLSFRFERLPRSGDRLRIVTWPSGGNAMFARRHFQVFPEDKKDGREMYFEAVSWWLVMDLQRRQAVPIPDFIAGIPTPERDGADIRFPRMRLPPTLPAREVCGVRVLRSDLDFNRHANNARYPAWIIETVPDDIWADMRLREFDLQYRAELNRGDELRLLAWMDPPRPESGCVIRHAVIAERTGKPAALARSRFQAPGATQSEADATSA